MAVTIEQPLELIVSSPSDTRKRKIPCRCEVLITSLQRFYNSSKEVNELLLPILKGESEISLRLIDWFVTTYAKKHNVSYLFDSQEFLVYLNYKSQLKAFSKKLFDPFCRRERIQFQCVGQEPFFTTVGQLNFFRWAFEKQIITYIKEHLQEISKEEKLSRTQSTNSTQSSTSSQQTVSVQSSVTVGSSVATGSTKSRRRRTEKVPSSVKLMHKNDVEVHLSFD